MIPASRIDGSFRPRQAEPVVAVELDGEAVLYHDELGAVYVLNPQATVVWACLDGSSDLDGLCDELAEAFSVGLDTLRGDVMDIVREFGRQGLLADVAPDPDVVAAQVPWPRGDDEEVPQDD